MVARLQEWLFRASLLASLLVLLAYVAFAYGWTLWGLGDLTGLSGENDPYDRWPVRTPHLKKGTP